MMHNTMQPEKPPSAISAEIGLRKQRLRQLLWMLIACLAFMAAINLFQGRSGTAGLEILSSLLLLTALWRNHQGDTRTAAWLTLTLLTAILLGLALANNGLYDEAPMALPGVLIFASMFASRRAMVMLAGGMVVALLAIYALHGQGALPNIPEPVGPSRLVALSLILLVTAVFVGLTSTDMDRLLQQLDAEKTALEQSNAQIAELAFHDSLTGLPNRALAHEHLQFLLAKARREQGTIALLYLDLDNFKTINDSLGHSVGDELLRQVAARLQENLREADMAARLSGDEFLLLLGTAGDAQSIASAATRLLQQLEPPFSLQEMPVHVSCSLGVSVYPRDGQTMQELLKNADLAMYQAKAAGRNTFRFFDESMNANMLEHLQLATSLREALAKDTLQLHYQPQFELESGRVSGAEALLRWPHPELGWIPPNKFIPVAESSGLIHELGRWVLHRACRDAQALRAQGLGDLSIAVNVSPLQFRRGYVDAELAQALQEAQLPASAIELEITESVLVDDNERLNQTLRRLDEMGVRIAIDDFGTGYSNLGYLQRYAVHRLKIDQSFTRQLTSSTQARGIVQAIIEMAHCLHLQVVAEGVEDAATLAQLQTGKCEYGQGYHWSAAMPVQEFSSFVAARQA